ncbi:MAG: M23 family metallopeptidase [Pseudomonadota bacterium]
MPGRKSAIALACAALAIGTAFAAPDGDPQRPQNTTVNSQAMADRALAAGKALVPVEELIIADNAIQGGVLLGEIRGDIAQLMLNGEPLKIAEDGRFMVAFNRDADSSALLTARFASGATESQLISVAKRKWNIERVNLPRRKRTASASWQRRRAPELEAIGAARAMDTGAEGWRQDFAWPAKGRISGMFGNQRIYAGTPGGYHTGIDIAAPTGTPIVAPADGVVTLAADKPFSLEGNLLMLDHGMGLNSAFLHLSKIAVRKGDRVRKGQYIGNIGATGSATGPHLHWSIKWGAARLDPILLTGPMS